MLRPPLTLQASGFGRLQTPTSARHCQGRWSWSMMCRSRIVCHHDVAGRSSGVTGTRSRTSSDALWAASLLILAFLVDGLSAFMRCWHAIRYDRGMPEETK